MLAHERLLYPSDGNVPGYVVQSIPDATEEVARQILVMQADAYAHHFSDPDSYPKPLDASAVRNHFHPGQGDEIDQSKISARQAKMSGDMQRGAQYLGITRVGGRPELTDERIAGLIKVSPSQSRIAALLRRDPNIFVNDIIVARELQAGPASKGNSAGAMLVHAALRHTGFSPDRFMALHAYDGDSVANWYGRLGLEKTATVVPPVTIAGENLPQALYTSEGHITISGIRRRLEHRHPQLRFGRLMNAEDLARYEAGD